MNYHPQIYPENKYHIYSHALGNDNFFNSEIDYWQFQQKYSKYINPVSSVYAYTLTPRNFDFVIQIKPREEILKHFKKMKKIPSTNDQHLPEFIMERFSNWLNSYVKSFNNRYGREGGLFVDYLKRTHIEKNSELKSIINKIHNLPVERRLCKSVSDWPWSSYKILTQNHPTSLLRNEVMQLFGSQNAFIKAHERTSMNPIKENGVFIH